MTVLFLFKIDIFFSGPFVVASFVRWYENQSILPSVEFSYDDGANWISIGKRRFYSHNSIMSS